MHSNNRQTNRLTDKQTTRIMLIMLCTYSNFQLPTGAYSQCIHTVQYNSTWSQWMVCLDQSQEHLPQQCWPVADAEAGLSCCLLAMLPSAHHPAALLDRTIAWHDQRSHVYTSHHIMHHNWWHHNWYQLDQTCLNQQLASARMNNNRSCNNYRAMRCLDTYITSSTSIYHTPAEHLELLDSSWQWWWRSAPGLQYPISPAYR